MHRRLVLALALGVAAAPALAQHAHPPRATAPEIVAGDLTLVQPWSRATPGGARVGGGYVVIRNRGTVPDRLLGGTMEAAGRVEIHEMATVDGVMRMRNLADGLVIPPGGQVELRPGGFHVMFLDLTRPLRQGETLRGTLRFERAGTVEVAYPVAAIGAGPDGATHRH